MSLRWIWQSDATVYARRNTVSPAVYQSLGPVADQAQRAGIDRPVSPLNELPQLMAEIRQQANREAGDKSIVGEPQDSGRIDDSR